MRRVSLMGVGGVLALAVAAVPVQAQYCAGYPTVAGQTSIGGIVGFPEGGLSLGVEANVNLAGPLAFTGNFNLLVPDEDGADRLNVFGAGVAYEMGQVLPVTGLSVCPVAAVSVTPVDGLTTLEFPLGLGFATAFGAEGMNLVAHAMPQFVLFRVGDEPFEHNFRISAGLTGIFGPLYAGAQLGRPFTEGADITFAVRGGAIIPTPF